MVLLNYDSNFKNVLNGIVEEQHFLEHNFCPKFRKLSLQKRFGIDREVSKQTT